MRIYLCVCACTTPCPLGERQYGTAYLDCVQPGPICSTSCGYFNNTFVVYESPDLVSWKLLSDNLVPAILVDNAVIEYDEVNVGFNGEYARECVFLLPFVWCSRAHV